MYQKKNTSQNRPKICLFSFPMGSALVVSTFIDALIEILSPICETVYIVTGNYPKKEIIGKKIKIIDVGLSLHLRTAISPIWWSNILQLLKIIFIQIKMAWVLLKISREIDITFFYVGGSNLFLPALIARLLRKHVITSAIGLSSHCYKHSHNKKMLSIGDIYNILEKFMFSFSDQIIVESPGVVDFLGIDKYRKKIVTSGARYIDINLFKIKKNLNERKPIIGFIGRLDEGKGIMDLVKAIPIVLEQKKNIKFFIGGFGNLYEAINKEIDINNMSKNINLVGWIPHDDVADHLNEFKLFILPSKSEGLPTGVLEAMACGTPVLVTPVGGITDVILDGKSGFILNDNSPEGIAQSIIRALDCPELNQIAKNARKIIEDEFDYDIAVKRYTIILNKHRGDVA